MNNPPIDVSSSHNTSQGLSSSSTPTPNRRLFVGQHDPPTTLSKNQYMAMAWQHITQTNPNISISDMENYVSQTEQAYCAYRLNFPPEPYSPPLPTIPHGFVSPLPMTPSYNPSSINVIVNQSTYTEKEREVITLKPDATLQEFLGWQKSARETLSLIDHHQDAILTRSRTSIVFGSSLSEAQIDTLYKTVWMKLHMATRKLCVQNAEIAAIESPQVHQLWNKLQSVFLPTTPREKFKLENTFCTLTQGKLTSRAYIQLIREKSNELRLIGMPIAKERIICLLLTTLNNDTLKLFIYNLSPALNADECLNSILQYDKSITNDNTDIPVDTPTPTALNVEQHHNSYKQPFQGRCFKCNMEGHRGFECPLNTEERISTSDIPAYYTPASQIPHDQQRYERSQMYQDNRYTYDHNQNHNKMERPISPYRGHNRNLSEPQGNERQGDNRTNYEYNRGSESDYLSNGDQSHYRQLPRNNNSYNNQSYSQQNYSDNQQNQYNCSHSSERKGYSEPRRDQRDRSRDRVHGTTSISRERSSHYSNRPSTPTRGTEAPMTRAQIRTLLTELLGNHQSGNSIQPQPKKLTIEGELDQHICDQVTHIAGATETDSHAHYRTFLMEVIDITDDSSDEGVQALYTGILSEYVYFYHFLLFLFLCCIDLGRMCRIGGDWTRMCE